MFKFQYNFLFEIYKYKHEKFQKGFEEHVWNGWNLRNKIKLFIQKLHSIGMYFLFTVLVSINKFYGFNNIKKIA